MIHLLLLFSFAQEADFGLVEPIAKQRQDGYELPQASFTSDDGVESWFIKEKGFESKEQVVKSKKRKKRNLASSAKKVKKKTKKHKVRKKRKKRSK